MTFILSSRTRCLPAASAGAALQAHPAPRVPYGVGALTLRAVPQSVASPLRAPARQVMRAEDRLWLTRPGPQVVHWFAQLADGARPQELEDCIRAHLHALPHFSQSMGRTERGMPCWQPVTDFCVGRHVRAVAVAGGEEALARALEALSTEPLPAAGPPWEAVLLQQPNQGTLLVLRTHHAMGDGRSLVEAMLTLHDDPAPAQAALGKLPTGRKYLGSDRGAVADGAQAVHDTFSTMTHLLVGPPEQGNPLKGASTQPPMQVHTWLGPWPVHEVKAAAHVFGGTVNDLLMTAIAGGLRRYLQAHHMPLDTADLHAVQIIAMPRHVGQQGGNAVSAVSTPIPVLSDSVAQRFAAVRATMQQVKQSWVPELMRAAQRLALWLPPWLQRALYDKSAAQNTIIVSNVQGTELPLRIAGHAVTDMRWFGPRFGNVGVQFSALSYAGQLTVGLATDPGVIQDAAALKAAVAAAYAEILAAARLPRAG